MLPGNAVVRAPARVFTGITSNAVRPVTPVAVVAVAEGPLDLTHQHPIMASKRNRPRQADPVPKGRKVKQRRASQDATSAKPAKEQPQLAAIMTKSLDLAEAGLSLGINLVERLGATLQDQVSSRLAHARDALAGAPAPSPAAADAGPGPRPSPNSSDREGPYAAPFSGVTNRLPLFPGSPVRVSFSINNDSADLPRKVELQLGGLAGELTGARLDAGHFAIEPAVQTIAPMDFEKFAITGLVPAGTRSDAYGGWIVVGGEHQLRIPVRLVVTAS
jgi:hypothetical protein